MSIIAFTRRIAAAVVFLFAAAQPLLAETFAERVAPCLACHGEKWPIGTSGKSLRLAVSPRPTCLIQLYLFRENQRASTFKKDDQMIEVMSEMTKGFTDDDLREFLGFHCEIAAAAKRAADAGDPARMQRGQRA